MSMGSFNITYSKFLIKLPTCNHVNVGNNLYNFINVPTLSFNKR